MEESYETFEEELWPPRADLPPQKPVRQIRRPEMYPTRKLREEMASQQTKAEPTTLLREPSIPKTPTMQPKSEPIQNLSQIDRPWENVTLNRCLFVAIAILVLTSGFQKLHETMRGQGTAEVEEDDELAVRRPGALRHRGQPPEPETTLWEVVFWWLPDFDDEDDDEDEDDSTEVKRVKSKRGTPARSSKGIRNKPLPDKNLMKQREGKLKDKRARKTKGEETKEKMERDKNEEPEEEAEDEEEEEVAVPKRTTKKKKTKTQ